MVSTGLLWGPVGPSWDARSTVGVLRGPEAKYGGPDEGSSKLELYGASQRDWSISRSHEKPRGLEGSDGFLRGYKGF